MINIYDHAARAPGRPAIILADTGESVSYGELAKRVSRLSHLLLQSGLKRGDHFAVAMENNVYWAEVLFAALHSGMQMVPVNRYLTAAEIAYIVRDSDSKALISSDTMSETMAGLKDEDIPDCPIKFMIGKPIPGWLSYDKLVAEQPDTPLEKRWMGGFMPYSSGTTGQPKGIIRPLPDITVDKAGPAEMQRNMWLHYFPGDSVFFTPAPIYHSSPINWLRYVLFDGGTFVTTKKFDAEACLAIVARYGVTHSFWVPTMFIRLLRLPDEVRQQYDLSSLCVVMHAGAPCPADVKAAMIEWLGPLIVEFYGATETARISICLSHEALAKPGTVGRPTEVHICDEEGREVPVGTIGQIYAPVSPFEYYGDPEKTARAHHPAHPNWATAGDIGYVDEDGYLFLTDRQAFMIISGGVNIYPQIIENALAFHPDIEDVAVIGVPDDDLGEIVKAVIQPRGGGSPELAENIMVFLRERVGRYMLPRSIDFVDELPRLASGKLHKVVLRSRYANKVTENPNAA